MAIANLGSIATKIQSRVDGIPSAISGAQLIDIVDQQRIYMESYTGLSIGSVAIAEKFQPAMTDLAIADLLENMQTYGADANSVTLGDFSITKNGESNIGAAAGTFREMGMRKLKNIGRKLNFSRVIG